MDINHGYAVHHIDRNKLNNDIKNLNYNMTEEEHSRLHSVGHVVKPKTRKLISEKLTGIKRSQETIELLRELGRRGKGRKLSSKGIANVIARYEKERKMSWLGLV